jgi:acyl-CoA reductase-like NAD-dependent aldehyde dehydrogenase
MSTERQMYIGGEWVDAASGRTFDDYDPFTGDVYAQVAAGTRDDAARAVAAAAVAFPDWAALAPEHKQRLFLKTADAVEERIPHIKQVLAEETGCGDAFAGFQLKWIVGALRQAAGWVYRPTGELIPSDMPGAMHMAVRRPLGVVASFSPWNGAQVLAWRAVIAPLAFGNTVVLKPSEHAPVAAGLLLPEIMDAVGWPAGVLNVVTHGPGEAGPIADEFFESPQVRCINFTGSSRTGRMLAERAGRHLKRIVLELGGYNPLIVLADADLDYAVDATAFGAFFHAGQICMNARKVIVQSEVADEFVDRLSRKAESILTGDPKRPGTIVGPLINEEAVSNVRRDIEDAVAKGARLLTGGDADGPVFRPTVLADVPDDATLAHEETFGPVLVVQRVGSIEEAIRVANDHAYGLSAGVLTQDADRGLAIAGQIEAGIVHVNDQPIHDEPQMPLGGVRDSGWGNAGPHSIEDFTQVQWVSVQSGTRPFPL